MRPLFGQFTNLTCIVYCLDLQIQTSSSLFGVKWILIGIPVSRSSATTSSVWNLDSNIRNITISFESCLLTRRTNICAAVRSLTNRDTLISQMLSKTSLPCPNQGYTLAVKLCHCLETLLCDQLSYPMVKICCLSSKLAKLTDVAKTTYTFVYS